MFGFSLNDLYERPTIKDFNTFANHIPMDDYNAIMNEYNSMFENLKAIGSGSFSTVYEYKNYAIKFYTEEECLDGEILHELGNNKWFPRLYFYNKDFMVVEKIDGITVEKLIYSHYDSYDYCFEPLCHSIVDNILNPLLKEKRYYANDIHNENLMITKDGRIVIVDVGLFSKFNSYQSANSDSECEMIKGYMDSVNIKVKRNKVIKDSKEKVKFDKVKLHFNDGEAFELNNINIEFKLQF